MQSEQKNGYRISDRRGGSGLVDQHGRALTRKVKAGFGLYPTPRYAGWDNYSPRPYITQGTQRGLSPFDRWELMNYSRQLFSQLGNLAGAIIQKNDWAVGNAWDPVHMGTDEAFGERTAEWLRDQFYPVCDQRGEPYDFKTALFLSGVGWDVDGDDAMITTETENGFPMLRFIPSHLIGTRETQPEVKGGPFDGAKMYDGVIFNRDGRSIGYRIIGEDDSDYEDIPAFNCQMLYEPEWKDQGRGIPKPGRVVLDCFDVQDIDKFLKRGVKLDSSQGLTHYTEDGEAEDGATSTSASELEIDGAAQNDTRLDPTVPKRGLQVEAINGGEILYMRANSGEKIESFKSDRPHPNTEAFIERIERRIILALGWSYDLLDLTAVSGAPSRLLKDLAMMAVQRRQGVIKRRALRAVRYAVCKAIKTGRIPGPKKSADGMEALRWDFEMPGEISIDTGNDEQADRENLKLGTMTLQQICAKKGYGNWQKLQNQSKKEIIGWVTMAKAIEQESGGAVTFEKAMELLTQRTPNGTPMSEMDDLTPAPPAPGRKSKK